MAIKIWGTRPHSEDTCITINAMPDLSVDEREFIMTGLTASDWEDMYDNAM